MKKVSKKALNKSFWNWYYGHLTCFSQEHMQTFGYLCAMLPIVEDLYDTKEEAYKMFRPDLVYSSDKEDWKKAIQDGRALDIIYLSKYNNSQKEFFNRNIHNLDDVLYVLKQVLARIKQEEKEVEEKQK